MWTAGIAAGDAQRRRFGRRGGGLEGHGNGAICARRQGGGGSRAGVRLSEVLCIHAGNGSAADRQSGICAIRVGNRLRCSGGVDGLAAETDQPRSKGNAAGGGSWRELGDKSVLRAFQGFLESAP